MSLPKIKDLINLNSESDISNEILILQKQLFELKIKKSTNQSIKTHLFIHTKRRISQLKYKLSVILKSTI